MSTIPDTPSYVRRLRGTKFYVIRNYWAFGFLFVAGVIAIPIVFSTRVNQNRLWLLSLFPSEAMVSERRFKLSSNLVTIQPEQLTKLHLQQQLESQEAPQLTKYHNIMKLKNSPIETP